MKEYIDMNQGAESPRIAKLAQAFVPLLKRMINDPDVVFTRPAEFAGEKAQSVFLPSEIE